MYVEFDNMVQYTGGNLLIAFNQTAVGEDKSFTWYGVSAPSGSARYEYGTYGPYSTSFLPKTSIDFKKGVVPPCATPKNFMALANESTVRAKEYGGVKEYVYQPSRSETSNVNGNTITVKDFNINLSGTLKLDAGNVTKNIDMYALLNDVSFMNALKDMIKTSINNDMNGGRYMNDLATMRGQISSSSLIGK